MARKRYLKKTPLIEARELFLATVDPSAFAVEEIAVDDGLDRITAEPVFAKISSPHYHASAMDGICVRAEDTFGATEFVGKTLTMADSDLPGLASFKYVDTGNALPGWANAVIMIEKVHQIDEHTLEIFESVAPWNHVRLVGEDVVATELLLPRAHRLRPYDLGALLAAGHTTVRVKARPKVGIIPTGDELIQPGEETKPGAVIDFNSTVLASFRARVGRGADQISARTRRHGRAHAGGAPGNRRMRCRNHYRRFVGGRTRSDGGCRRRGGRTAGARYRRHAGKTRCVGQGRQQAIARCARLSGLGDRHRARDFTPGVGKISRLGGAGLSDCARHLAEKNCLASRLGGIYSRYSGTSQRKAGRGAAWDAARA